MLHLLGILILGNMIFGGGRCGRHGYHRHEAFPGILFILPALMFGGWMAIAIVGGVLSLVGSIIGGIFSGLTSLASGAFSGGGVLIGIAIGLALYFYIRRQKIESTEEE